MAGAFLLAKEYDRHISGYEDRQHTILQDSDCPRRPRMPGPLTTPDEKGRCPQAALERPFRGNLPLAAVIP